MNAMLLCFNQLEVGVVEEILYDSYHDGFRLYWQNQNFVDSEGCTYSLQVGLTGEEYTIVYRGTAIFSHHTLHV